jgi:selenocysteine lyase/cysteine desulfurase
VASPISRDLYAALARCTYLNQAALGLIPRPAVEAMQAYLERTAQFGNLHLSDEQEAATLDDLRAAGAALLGAPAGAVAVVGGASEGLGQVASLLEPGAGTVVLVSSDFPSVTYPWLALAERRPIALRFVEDRADRDLTEALLAAIDRETAVVSFGVVQYGTGSAIDTGQVVERAHEVGARVVADVSQLAGAGPVDMAAWRADAVVSSGYKWLSGHGGVGLLALSAELAERSPRLVGWKGAEHPFAFDARALRLAAGARRFELSTMSYASAVGLLVSLDLLASTGVERIQHHARGLARRLVATAAGAGWRPFRSPDDRAASSHIVSLRHPRHDAAGVAARLAGQHGVVCGGRAGGLRVSLHAYNDDTDVDRLVTALHEIDDP